jgi:predicted transcriptional regulator
MSKKTNITLKLDADLLRRIKVLAAERGTSVSAILTSQLEQVVTRDEEYEEAMKRAISLMNESTASGWQKPRSRDELHER